MTGDRVRPLYASRGFNRRLWDCSLPTRLNLSVHVVFQNTPAGRLSAEDTQRLHRKVSNVSLHKLQLLFIFIFFAESYLHY